MVRDHPVYGGLAIAIAIGLEWMLMRRWRRAARTDTARRTAHGWDSSEE